MNQVNDRAPLAKRAMNAALHSATGGFCLDRACEFLGGIGLLPAITGVKPKLTPFAAFGLTLVMVLAAVFHSPR
jgi:hypothetical protein